MILCKADIHYHVDHRNLPVAVDVHICDSSLDPVSVRTRALSVLTSRFITMQMLVHQAVRSKPCMAGLQPRLRGLQQLVHSAKVKFCNASCCCTWWSVSRASSKLVNLLRCLLCCAPRDQGFPTVCVPCQYIGALCS